jgi:hypothetical protein
MLSPQQVIEINQFLDEIHSFFPYVTTLGAFLLLESLLPYRTPRNVLERNLNYTKLIVMSSFVVVTLTQGIFGGCLLHIPQNWLAQEVLGKKWHEYGLVYRYSLPQAWWPALQLFYVVLGSFGAWRTWHYYQRRILGYTLTTPVLQKWIQISSKF